jgi:hypothetical protein
MSSAYIASWTSAATRSGSPRVASSAASVRIVTPASVAAYRVRSCPTWALSVWSRPLVGAARVLRGPQRVEQAGEGARYLDANIGASRV